MVTGGTGPLYCNRCYASKQASSSRKRRYAETPKKATRRTRNVPFDRDDPDYSSILASPRTVTDIEEGRDNHLREVAGHLGSRDLPHGKRHPSSNVRPSVGKSDSLPPARRVASPSAHRQSENLPPAVEQSDPQTLARQVHAQAC
jgi:hypothetical protein